MENDVRATEIEKGISEDLLGSFKDIDTDINASAKTQLSPMSVNDEVGKLLRQAVERHEAAMRGLAIADRLRDPEERAKHKSRMMANKNSLKALVTRIQKIL